MHVYKENYEISFAVPFDVTDKNIVEICKYFLDRLNVIEYAQVIQRYSIDDLVN